MNQTQTGAYKTIVGGSLINFFGNIIGLLDPLYLWAITRFYGDDKLGSYILATTYVTLFVRLGLMGFDKGIKRAIPFSQSADDVERAQVNALGTSIRYIVLFTTVGAIGLFLLADLLIASTEDGTPTTTLWLKILIWIAPVEAVTLLFVHALRGAQRMWPFVFVRNFLTPSVMILVGVGGALVGWDSTIVLYAYLASRLVSIVPAIVMLKREFSGLSFWRLVSGPRDTALLKFSFPLGISEFLIYFMVRADVVMIMFYYPDSPQFVAFYGIASMFSGMIKKIRHGFDESFGPLLAGMLARNERDNAIHAYQNVGRWLVLLILLVGPAAAFASPFILSIFGKDFAHYWAVVPILISSRIVAAAIGPTQVVLLMAGKSKTEFANNLGGNILNISLNVLLIPRFGVYGAAVATSSSIIALYIVRAVQIYRATGIYQSIFNIHRILIAAALAMVPGIVMLMYTEHIAWTVAATASYLIMYPMLLGLFKTGVDARMLLAVLKSKKRSKLVAAAGDVSKGDGHA